MEDSLPNTSVLPLKPSGNGGISRIVFRSITMVVLGIFFGGCVVFIQNTASYNRIVVFNQPNSSTVRLASVRLKKPGYVVILSEEEGGWLPVGMSFYLSAGYHQNLTIDVGIPHGIEPEHKDMTEGNYVPHSYVARIYVDRGAQYYFEEFTDELVRDARGAIYQKRFWTDPSGSHIKAFARWFIDNPLGNVVDVAFPY